MSEACGKLEQARGTLHGDDDVVFGDVTLLKYHVRQVYGVNLEPGNGGCSTKEQDMAAAHTQRRPARPCATNSVQNEVHAAVRQGTW